MAYYINVFPNIPVVKRSASQSGVFGQFAGNSIMEVDIVNLEDFE